MTFFVIAITGLIVIIGILRPKLTDGLLKLFAATIVLIFGFLLLRGVFSILLRDLHR